jgi:murein DD-endopeptidase MepM/ murein hydrolase activator NlpD
MKVYEKLKISSHFGLRDNPTSPGNKHFHRGIDFIPDETQYVYAGFSGIVNRVSKGKLEGNYIQIFTKLNGIPFYINMFHLKYHHNWLKERMFVRPNDDLGIAGTTGNSTGIHIHYEIFTYKLDAKFIELLKKEINHHIVDGRAKRLFFEPFQLFEYCKKHNIYV